MPDKNALEALGIDAQAGIAYCADDPEFFGEMLGEYLAESAGRAAELEQYFSLRDWGRYGICAHSVKSTSQMIGAGALSDLARGMELAAKNGDEASLLAGHGCFLAAFTDLADGLRSLMG